MRCGQEIIRAGSGPVAAERFHLTMLPLAKAPASDRQAQARAFEAFRREYNEERLHEALGMGTPAQHYRPLTRAMPKAMPEPDYPVESAVRRVRQNGEIKWNGDFIYVSRTLAGEAVAATETEDGRWALHFYAHPLGFIDGRHKKLVRRSAVQTRPNGAAADSNSGGRFQQPLKRLLFRRALKCHPRASANAAFRLSTATCNLIAASKIVTGIDKSEWSMRHIQMLMWTVHRLVKPVQAVRAFCTDFVAGNLVEVQLQRFRYLIVGAVDRAADRVDRW